MTDARIGDEVTHRVALKLGHGLQAKTVDVGRSEASCVTARTAS
jgi:hypothetical protein